jgi:hypothetical protein
MTILLSSLILLGALQEPSSTPPILTRIVIQPDTVWFTGTVWRTGADSTSYALVRSTGRWLRVARRSFPPEPKLVPATPRDTVLLAPGFALVLRQERERSGDTATTSQLGVLTKADERFVPLVPVLPADQAERLRPPEGLWYGTAMDAKTKDLPLAGVSGAWAADREAVWFGLSGGFSEGDGGVGGLLRYDLKSSSLESIWNAWLLQASVTSMAIAGGGLWIGTLHPGEYGAWGHTGLLRYDLRTRDWLRYQSDTTPLPGNLIWNLASDGHRIWLSTDQGLAELNLRTGRWRVGYFEPALRGDSVVYELVPVRPSPVNQKAFALMLRLGVRRQAEFLETVRRRTPEAFRCDMEDGDCQIGVLAAEPLVPFLVEALNGSGGDLAARALEKLGNRDVLPSLRQSLGTAQPLRAPSIALALAHLGDTAGPAWIRRRLEQRPPPPYLEFTIGVAAQLRDPANIPALLRLLHSPDHGQSAMSALEQFASPRVWQQAADSVLGDTVATAHFLLVVQYSKAPYDDPRFRQSYGRIIDAALESRSRQLRTLAAQNLIQRRDPRGIPELIRLMTEDQYWMPLGEKLRVLVEATGVDSLPVSSNLNWDSDSSEIRKAQAVWMSWWEKSRRHVQFVSEDEGRAALERWRRRWPAPQEEEEEGD